MKNKIQQKRYVRCSVCGSKINFFRRMVAKKLDKKGEFSLTQQQFCSPKCSKIGIKILSEISSVKQDQKTKFIEAIDYNINRISMSRQEAIRKYGSIQRIPPHVMHKLYPGSISILNNVKAKFNETEKKRD